MARMRRWSMAGMAAVLATWLATSAALAADTAVTIVGLAYDPSSVTIQVGDTVTWTNQDSVAHTATAGDGSFDTGNLGNGASATVTFDTAGSFAYTCTIHATMTGTVVVEAVGATPAPTTAPVDGGAAITPAPSDTLPPIPPDPDRETRLVAATLAILGVAMLVGTLVADRRFRERHD